MQSSTREFSLKRGYSNLRADTLNINHWSLRTGKGTGGGGEFLEEYQNDLPCSIGVSNILEKIARYIMRCEIIWNLLQQNLP